MFRVFLRKKIFSGAADESSDGTLEANSLMPSLRQTQRPASTNRRSHARYAIDHKHLTLMNEQDILLVREISLSGFSTDVSPRAYDRLTVGDVYAARIRYLKEMYDLQAKVAWKHAGSVGFSLAQAEQATMLFIKRLLRPVEIAKSLSPVEASFTIEGGQGKVWLHGDEESDLYAWHGGETNSLIAWQLVVGSTYVEWRLAEGLSSGTFAQAAQSSILPTSPTTAVPVADADLDARKYQFAFDIIMALQHPLRDSLLETISLDSPKPTPPRQMPGKDT